MLLSLCLLAVCAQEPGVGPYRPPIEPASDEGRNAMAGFVPAEGFEVELVAAEPHLANPVAFTVDPAGRIYVVETFRLKTGVFDTRDYRHWLDDDLACETVEDRVAMYRKHFEATIEEHRVHHERLKLLIDDDGDGVTDRSTVFADGFCELEDGIAAGVLVDGDDVWYTCIPRVWKLRDDDRDGEAEVRQAVHDGFGVHVSLIGHDMHGLQIGPDRRLYFSIGDRGFHVQNGDRTLAYPHEGAVLRCELDGSDLEVYHRGLRNPQELAFDAYGNLFTGDNNSDGGDLARWVYVIEGGNSGWCIGFQWLASRGSWHRDRLWHTEHPGQAAWVLPPVAHIANGPSGLDYYPGTGLSDRFRDTFLLCEFRGSPTSSGVLALQFQPHGATFELRRQERLIWNVLPTDVEFAIDGNIYISDWVIGWDRTGKGRMYRLKPTEPDPRIEETQRLLAEGMAGRGKAELLGLLHHPDQRVRQEAQFALVDLGPAVVGDLAALARDRDDQLARLHALWGLGCIARLHDHPAALDELVPLLREGDARVRAQAAKVLGDDGPHPRAFRPLRRLVTTDPNAQVRLQAALSLGKLGRSDAIPTLLELLEHNRDDDPYLRHGAVRALIAIGDVPALIAAAGHANRSVRLGVLLAMRELGRAELAVFLSDRDTGVVAAAARAIYDVPIEAAMPALARQLARPDFEGHDLGEALCRRAINAHRYLGQPENATALAGFCSRDDVPAAMRLEALEVLGEWNNPHGQDRVFGNWRPARARPETEIDALVTPVLSALLDDDDASVREAAARSIGRLRLDGAVAPLVAVVDDRSRDAASRDAALGALGEIAPADLLQVATRVGEDDPPSLRKTAVRILSKLDPRSAVAQLASLAADGPIDERQNALVALGELEHEGADRLLLDWLGRLAAGAVPEALHLELLEAAAKRSDAAVEAALASYEAERQRDGAAFSDVLAGGDVDRGRRVFFEKDTTQCMRCHKVGDRGGDAGPALDGIAGRVDRDYLLRSLVEPQAEIAEGFGNIVLTLNDGELLAGFFKSNDGEIVTIVDAENQTVKVPTDTIAERTPLVSAMPPMPLLMSRREMRDVMAYLQSLR